MRLGPITSAGYFTLSADLAFLRQGSRPRLLQHTREPADARLGKVSFGLSHRRCQDPSGQNVVRVFPHLSARGEMRAIRRSLLIIFVTNSRVFRQLRSSLVSLAFHEALSYSGSLFAVLFRVD